MKILVTGGAGFIGSNLCGALLERGDEVVCLDNFSTGHHHNIEPFLSQPHFRLIEGDIRDLDTCRSAVSGVDYVLHEAALGSVPRSIKEYLSAYDPAIATMEVQHRETRAGDIPHSLASIDKARHLLSYNPSFSMREGLKVAVKWYFENLK